MRDGLCAAKGSLVRNRLLYHWNDGRGDVSAPHQSESFNLASSQIPGKCIPTIISRVISSLYTIASRYLHTPPLDMKIFAHGSGSRKTYKSPKKEKGLSHKIHPSIHASNQSIQSPPPTPESTSTPETHLKDKPSSHLPPKKVTWYRFYSPLPLHPSPTLQKQ